MSLLKCHTQFLWMNVYHELYIYIKIGMFPHQSKLLANIRNKLDIFSKR